MVLACYLIVRLHVGSLVHPRDEPQELVIDMILDSITLDREDVCSLFGLS